MRRFSDRILIAVMVLAFSSCRNAEPAIGQDPPPPEKPHDFWTIDKREYWKPQFRVFSDEAFWYIQARTYDALLTMQFKEFPSNKKLYRIVDDDPETPEQVKIIAFTGKSPHAVMDPNLGPGYYSGYMSMGGSNAWLSIATIQGQDHYSSSGIPVRNFRDSTVIDTLYLNDLTQITK